MIFYPVRIEPHGDNFIARFRDVPEADHVGDQKDDALCLAVEYLQYALADMYLVGKAMPLPSPTEPGEIAVAASFYWVLA